MRPSDIYWLAGFLEGEGWFFCKPGSTCTVGVCSTDEDMIVRAASILGCKPNGPYSNGASKSGVPHKPKWQAYKCSAGAAGWMMTLYPQMSSRRRKAIRDALAVWRQQPVTRAMRTHCLRGGHPLSGSNLYINPKGERSCRTCFSRAGRRARNSVNSTDGLPPSSVTSGA
jgi:hypothetical protein